MLKWTEYTDGAKSNRIPQQIEPRLETASLLDPVSGYKTNDNLICASQKLNFAIMRLNAAVPPSGAALGTPYRARTTAGGTARSRAVHCVSEIWLAQCKLLTDVLGSLRASQRRIHRSTRLVRDKHNNKAIKCPASIAQGVLWGGGGV